VREEFVIRLTAPLRGIVQTDPGAPLPPLSPPGPPTPPPAPPAPPSAPVDPATLWETEMGRELSKDRVEISRTLVNLTAAVSALEARQQQQWIEWQRAAVELGVTIAARILHDKIQAGDYPVETMARQAAARLHTEEPVTLRLHPADLQLLEQRLDGRPLFAPDADVRLVGDATLGRGDCRAEAGETTVFAELGSQLADVRRELLRSLGHAESEP
jgi:flagellar assembly protein FliH